MATKNVGYKEIIDKVAEKLEHLEEDVELWNNDKLLTQLFAYYKTAIYSRIHRELVPLKTDEAETEIREILSRNVIGYTKKEYGKAPQRFVGSISPLKLKIAEILKKDKLSPLLQTYTELLDDFLALAAFRSFKHFCQYIERPAFGIDLWKNNERAFNGYWFYMNRMILDGEVNFIEKQLPTGTGKSLSDCFAHSFIFGIDIDATILKICGNDTFTKDCLNNVVSIMTTPQYAKVFPYYEQFECNKNLMFTFCSTSELALHIRGCSHSTSLRICSKFVKTNGVRAKYLFVDDITQQDDTSAQMEKDINKMMREWYRRNFNLNFFFIVASGTAYSQFDLLSWLKMKNNFDKSEQSPINEFTRVAKSNFIKSNGTAVFITVPALDEKDKSVFPTIRSRESLIELRNEDFATFMAMEQQQPLPPEGTPFYFTKLRSYEELPPIGTQGRLDYCVAALDPKRRGTDRLSMPICFEAIDPENADNAVFYVKDWLYDERPMKDCIPLIVSKIIQHKITKLYAERNTDELIGEIIQEQLQKKGYYNCVIETVFNTMPKDKRILNEEGNIRSQLIFPDRKLYAQSSNVGQALLNLYQYSYSGKNVHDDAPDSVAMFTSYFVGTRRKRGVQKKIIDLR